MPPRSPLGIRAAVLMLALGGSVRGAGAQSAPPLLRQLDHTAWTIRDGAPTDVVALVQSDDGVLWIGSPQGLFRFDGLRFERAETAPGQTLLSQNVSAVSSFDHGLWIGYRFGGASRLVNGQLTHFGVAEGLSSSTVWDFARDSNGTVWAATGEGVVQLADGRWRSLGATYEFPKAGTYALLVDSRGTLWAATTAGVYALPRGAAKFTRRAASLGDVNVGCMREAPDGSVWGVSVSGKMHVLSDSARSIRGIQQPVGARTLLIDSEQYAWLAVRDGVWRVSLDTALDGVVQPNASAMTRADGLSGNAVLSFLRDREGNVWVGTEAGVDRFRPAKLTRVPFANPVLGPSVAAADDGGVWIGTLGGPTYHVAPGTKGSVRARTGAPANLTSAYRDANGDVWLGGALGGVWRAHAGAPFEQVPLPRDIADAAVQAMARDHGGRLWVSMVRRGVRVLSGGTWSDFGASLGIANTPAVTITADTGGTVWLGYTESRVVRERNGALRLFAKGDGLDVGTVMAIHLHGDHVWVGGELGVEYFDGTRFHPVRLTSDLTLHGVSGIAETSSGELWLNGAEGITRLPADEVRRALADSTHRVRAERLDFHDGVDGGAPQIRPQPSVIAGTDGRLWFLTASSVLWLDPAHVRRNTLPPPVQIRVVEAAGRLYDPSTRITLPTRTTALRLQFTALSLAIPDRVRFRYRLAGSDTGWQDAGTRREAFYTNLRPGAYRFHVIAANEDGVWNNEGAAVDIVIPPTFVQTTGFLLVCAAAVIALGAILLRWRQRQVTRAMRAHFDATLAERTRIAQELHDTLLQGFTGVTLQLYAVQRTLTTRPTEAAESLARALEGADATLLEARHAVWEMRSPELDSAGLPDALAVAARDAVAESTIELHVSTRGAYRPLPRPTEMTVLRVGREAVTNAVRHADARAIELALLYDAHALTLVVRDDGCGFSPADADGARHRGHWGLVGMRERAAVSGAKLDIDSAPGLGTRIELTIPIAKGA